MRIERLGIALCCCALLAVAAPLAAAEAVHPGADLWQTASGFTFTTFAENPIPAGFFCAGSRPFNGVISMHGAPLSTRPAGALGKVDTIIRRLDEASFNIHGEASTRIQLLALSLASEKPVEIPGCGSYDVRAVLDGEQPVTEMKILRTSIEGGTYVAPLDLNVRLTFTPVDGKGAVRTLTNRVSLGPGSESVWSYSIGNAAKLAVQRRGEVAVDSDGDGQPDLQVPAPSNFVAGFDPAALSGAQCAGQSCHCAERSTNPYEPNSCCKHLHCVEVTVSCDAPVAPLRPSPTPCPTTSSDG